MHESYGYVERGWDAMFYFVLPLLTNGCKLCDLHKTQTYLH